MYHIIRRHSAWKCKFHLSVRLVLNDSCFVIQNIGTTSKDNKNLHIIIYSLFDDGDHPDSISQIGRIPKLNKQIVCMTLGLSIVWIPIVTKTLEVRVVILNVNLVLSFITLFTWLIFQLKPVPFYLNIVLRLPKSSVSPTKKQRLWIASRKKFYCSPPKAQ